MVQWLAPMRCCSPCAPSRTSATPCHTPLTPLSAMACSPYSPPGSSRSSTLMWLSSACKRLRSYRGGSRRRVCRQRVAVSAVANACKKIPADCSQFVMDSVPMLCNLLQSDDKMVVEKVATCLISIVDSFSGSLELLDQLCHQGVVEKVLPLINTGGLASLSPSTCSNLIGLLAKLACNSLVAVKSLFELNVGSTIKGILVSLDFSHGMPYLPLENQNNQVNEALKLAIQLIP